MKCVCGYEKVGANWKTIPAKEILYSSGKNKGKIKKIEPEHTIYEDIDPHRAEFISITIEKDFEFQKTEDGDTCGVELYACPACGTIKIDI